MLDLLFAPDLCLHRERERGWGGGGGRGGGGAMKSLDEKRKLGRLSESDHSIFGASIARKD